MYNKFRLKSPLPWNLSLNTWLRTPWLLRQDISRRWLVGEWLFDNNALDTNDGTKNNGTATNVTYANTDVGYQSKNGSFNGSSSYIRSSSSITEIWGTALVSISFWAKPDSVWSFQMPWIYRNASAASFFIAFNTASVQLAKYTWWVQAVCNSSSILNTTTYQHIVCTYDWANLRVYINWVLDATTASTWNIDTLSSAWWDIWQNNWVGGQYFSGKIQMTRVYNRVLLQQEIDTLYKEWLKLLN